MLRSLLLALLLACLPTGGLLVTLSHPGFSVASPEGGSFIHTTALAEKQAECDKTEEAELLGLTDVEDVGDTSTLERVPGIGKFQNRWRKFAHEGLIGKTELLPGVVRKRKRCVGGPCIAEFKDLNVRMVLGIFTTDDADAARYRAVIRSTWMTQPWVCEADVRNGHRTDCRIYYTFVVGSKSQNSSSTTTGIWNPEGERSPRIFDRTTESDLTFINIPEGINCGKTWAWFRFASDTYDPTGEHGITHIGKMDMDAYVDVQMLLQAMGDFSTHCPNVFGGRFWWCNSKHPYCPPKNCGYPLDHDFLKYESGKPGCWSYMQGGFYFMTRVLASKVSKRDDWWDATSENCYPEDAVTGQAVFRKANETKECVAAMDLRGRAVVWHPDVDGRGFWDNITKKPV